MDDRIRISDADRDRVAARLRDHFADGRLTADEFDERITATLNAKTFGDLRRVMTDLPESPPPSPQEGLSTPRSARPRIYRHRGPRVLPVLAVALLAVLVIPGGGWLFVLFFKMVLLFWLAACLAGIFVASRIRRRMRRDLWFGYGRRWHPDWRSGQTHWHPYRRC